MTLVCVYYCTSLKGSKTWHSPVDSLHLLVKLLWNFVFYCRFYCASSKSSTVTHYKYVIYSLWMLFLVISEWKCHISFSTRLPSCRLTSTLTPLLSCIDKTWRVLDRQNSREIKFCGFFSGTEVKCLKHHYATPLLLFYCGSRSVLKTLSNTFTVLYT